LNVAAKSRSDPRKPDIDRAGCVSTLANFEDEDEDEDEFEFEGD
jgi:hypothetical protein